MTVAAPPSDRRLGGLMRLAPMLRPYLGRVIGAIAALVVAAASVLIIGVAMRRVVDHGFSGDEGQFIDLYFAALMGVVALLAAATFARFYLVTWLGERIVADMRQKVFSHLLDLSPVFFETAKTGEVLSRLTTDTELIQTVVGSSASVALRNLLLFLGGSAMLAVTSPKLAGLSLLIVPAVVVPIVVLGRRVRALSRASQDSVAGISAYAGETLGAIQTVQAFTHEGIDRKSFGATVEGAFGVALKRIRARAWLTAIVILFIFGAVDMVLWIGGRDVFEGRMSAGELAAFVFYAVVVAGALGALSEVWGELQRASGAAERLFELLDTRPAVRAPERPVALPHPAKGEIVFEAVEFRYPARPKDVALDAVALRIRSGENVALVGPSGAGKSTIFNLLLRYHDPSAGRILVDGVDIAAASPIDLRSRFAIVAQEPTIFAASARENIRYGRPGATDAEVRRAAEAAACGFLDRLPEGYDTFLGERGVRLSGGQRQRLAIARAVLRDPAILLLDEATSALDAESERKVQLALEHLMKGRTTLVIAHRLATVLKADRIVVLDKGRVVATGSHAELMREDGLYARLARLQFDQGGGRPRAVGD
jgi:ATP-binding cassette subfamily B protein